MSSTQQKSKKNNNIPPTIVPPSLGPFDSFESFISFLKGNNTQSIKVNKHEFNVDVDESKTQKGITFVASIVQKLKGNNVAKYALIKFSESNGFEISMYTPWKGIMIDSDNSIICVDSVSQGIVLGLTQTMKLGIFSDIMSVSHNETNKLPLDELQELITTIDTLLITMLKDSEISISEEIHDFKLKLLKFFGSDSLQLPDLSPFPTQVVVQLTEERAILNNRAHRTTPTPQTITGITSKRTNTNGNKQIIRFNKPKNGLRQTTNANLSST